MAMTKCPECGDDISDQASQCPHCGVEFKGPQSTGEWLGETALSLIAALLLIGALGFLCTGNVPVAVVLGVLFLVFWQGSRKVGNRD